MTTRRSEFLNGMRTSIPILIGAAPFGFLVGVAATQAGFPLLEAVASSIIVFAGASQLAASQLIGDGALIVVVWFTVLVINLRFVMYSTALAPHWEHLSLKFKLLAAYVLTDQAFAFTINRYNDERDDSPYLWWYFMGFSCAMWLNWLLATIMGAFFGVQVPDGWGLEFAIPLMFMALAFIAIKSRPIAWAALVSAVASVLLYGLPYNLGLIVSALLGIGVGLALDARPV